MSLPRKACRRYNEIGHAHFLTFSCFRRQKFLSKERSRNWFIDAVNLARQKHDFHLWAYVIMPEHVHLLIWPTQAEYNISKMLKTIKQSVARKSTIYVKHNAPEFLNRMEDRQTNGKGAYRFWQRGGGFDGNLTEPKAIWKTVE